jgi:hypothetical protein
MRPYSGNLPTVLDHVYNVGTIQMLYTSNSQSVLRVSQGIGDQFPGDPWIQFRKGHIEIFLFN